ncbi:MAG: hypothetical protein ABIH23_23740 [bacterium]
MTSFFSFTRMARLGCLTVGAFLVCFLCVQGAVGAGLTVDSVEFVQPGGQFSRYHLALNVANETVGTATVTSVAVDGAAHENIAVFVDETLSKDNTIPTGKKACVRLSFPWLNSTEYAIQLNAEAEEPFHVLTKAATPSKGGYWNAAWKEYKVLNVAEEAGINRQNEPVTVMLNLPVEQLRDPAKELRLVQMNQAGGYKEVPIQILETSSVNVESEDYPDTIACRFLFYATIQANSTHRYIIFFDNPNAPAPTPPEPTGLEVTGEGLGLTIENPYYRITLAKQSGQINGIFIKQGVEQQLSHAGNAIHWNPGCYSPPRPWGHTYDWNPPEGNSETRGPFVYILKRWGILPQLPEVWVSVTYKFFAHKPHVLMSSTISVREDIDVLALRNDEMVFEPQLFSDLGWRDKQGTIHTMPLGQNPSLEIGYTQVLPADTPWLCFFKPEGGYGYGSLRLAYGAANTEGVEPVRYNEATHITAPSSIVYWYRGLIYHYFPSGPKHLFTKAKKGSVYHETNAYLPFPLVESSGKELNRIDGTYERLTHPLQVSLVDWGRDDLLAVGQREKK